MPIPVTAIFDIGKTNKKFFLFDSDLNEVFHDYCKMDLINDDDGFPCDDLHVLTNWIRRIVNDLASSTEYVLKAINFSTYGATLVHLDESGQPATPLYNYLKPFPEEAHEDFINKYGGESNDRETASPFLGMLNSGLQLYWLKHCKPEVFKRVHTTLHFPQYLSYLFTGKLVSEPTSIGCHTRLWDFEKNQYHNWLKEENLLSLFPPIVPTIRTYTITINNKVVNVGVGVHDSSAALTSYYQRSTGPFLLVSTGTWSITLNPFTEDVLSAEDLSRDCLNFLNINGKPVRASRLFLGHELDHQLAILNNVFGTNPTYYKQVKLNSAFKEAIENGLIDCLFYPSAIHNSKLVNQVLSPDKWNPSVFSSFDEAYHHLMWGLVKLQVESIRLALGNSNIKHIFVDGGFVDNELYIHLLQYYLPGFQLEVSDQPLGSAYGAALVMNHEKASRLSNA